jgi:hypothetical protein
MKNFSKRWFVLLLLMGTLLLSLTGCAGWTGSVIWTMCIFFFWMIYIWMFITVFADIFRRHDMKGWKKAFWIIFVIFIPLIGIIAYMIARPKHLAQDAQMMEQAQPARHPAPAYSEADEIAKAQALLNSGAITQAEFDEMKRKALG